jgi:outer membrane protein TolC
MKGCTVQRTGRFSRRWRRVAALGAFASALAAAESSRTVLGVEPAAAPSYSSGRRGPAAVAATAARPARLPSYTTGSSYMGGAAVPQPVQAAPAASYSAGPQGPSGVAAPAVPARPTPPPAYTAASQYAGGAAVPAPVQVAQPAAYSAGPQGRPGAAAPAPARPAQAPAYTAASQYSGGAAVPAPVQVAETRSYSAGPQRPATAAVMPPSALNRHVTWGQATSRLQSATASLNRPKVDSAIQPATSSDPKIAVNPSPPVVPPPPQVFPVDLSTALRLAEVENPEIAEARQRILEAAAIRQGAYALLLPTLNAGAFYHGHTGDLQRSSGRILSLSEQSVYFGGGTRTLAAESLAIPAVNISSPLTDAIFEPLAARQEVTRAGFEAAATTNSVLLEVGNLYFELVAAETELGLRQETEAEAVEAARLTAAYAKSGEGFLSDADRAATLTRLIHREVEKAEEEVAVAAARLSRRLHLDPVVRIRPVAPGIAPISLIDPSSPTEDLVQAALRGRPEMGATTAAIGVAETRLKQELARPLLPTVWLGFSGGGFGGGSNLVTPLMGNFGGRTDFDVRAFWTLQGMGLGNLSLQKSRRARIGQAMGEQSLAINRIRREVASAKAEVIASRQKMDSTYHQLETSLAGFREDLDRLRNTVGRPIELTNSLELLAQARVDHLRAIRDYNQSQLRLFVSLGTPPPVDRPPTEPLPPAPVASPPLPLAPIR